MPVAQLFRGQALDLDLSELRQDKCLHSVPGVLNRFPVGRQERQVVVHNVFDGQRSVLSGSGMRTLDHPLASERLGLPVVQDRHAIGVTEVVSRSDCLKLVSLVPDVMPGEPLAGAAKGLAVP